MATKSKQEPDFLDEMVDQFTVENPQFPELLDAASRRRAALRALADERRSRNLSQTTVAAAMKTSQSALARLETAADTKMSTFERYAAALGFRVEYRLVAADASSSERRSTMQD
jgi:hypothetical protein